MKGFLSSGTKQTVRNNEATVLSECPYRGVWLYINISNVLFTLVSCVLNPVLCTRVLTRQIFNTNEYHTSVKICPLPMWTLWISPFIKACFSSLNTEGGFKYYILCSVLTSLRNNPVGCFYAIHKILDGKRNLVLLVEYASLRYVDCFFPSRGRLYAGWVSSRS